MTTTGDSDSGSSSSESNSNDNFIVKSKNNLIKEDGHGLGLDSASQSPHNWGHNNGATTVPAAVVSQESTRSSTSSTAVKSSSSSRSHRRALEPETNCLQVANIAPQATRDQMAALFGYMGKIEDLRLYPTMDMGMQLPSKICFVKFRDSASVGVAQHLTNTVFVDRALIVIPYTEGELPDEIKGLELLNSGSVLPGVADPKLPQHVTSQLEGVHPHQVVITTDPKLTEQQLPPYPNLPPTFDSRRIEEIRRTIMVANLDPDLSAHEVSDFFSNVGEVKYIRLCTRDNDPLRYALIEFTEQPSVLGALKCNGTELGSKHIKVYHSTQAIVKPQAKTNEAAQKEIEEAMTRQAQNLLTQGLDGTGKDKRRTPSPLRGRHSGPRPLMSIRRSRTRSPRRRSGSRSRRRRSRTRSRSPRRSRRSRSRSHGGSGRVLRSPHRYRSRSKSRDRERERKRSSSRSRRSKKSSSRDRKKHRKSKKDKDKDRRSKDRESKEKGKENGVKRE